MAYRAHHCRAGDDKAFLDSYHALWEEGRYFEGWMWTESEELGFSYRMRRRVRGRITAAPTDAARDVAESVGHGASEAAYIPPRVPLDLT